MQLHSMVIDGFLADFGAVRAWADAAEYGPVTNPVDGVVYPGICTDIPPELRDEVHRNLCIALATNQLNIRTMFTRLSVAGVQAPHQAHNDASMGMFSLMVYLNRPEDCDRWGGTELVEHRSDTLMRYGPRSEVELERCSRDCNRSDAWGAYSRCTMQANRAFIFDARLMHRAMPVQGFGKDARDGRLVLTAFLDC